MSTQPKTRILIISDTHGLTPRPRPNPFPETDPYDLTILPSLTHPLPAADVAIHCGDHTLSWRISSSLKEYRTALSLLRSIPAPLKIAIPGNHDTALDKRWFHDPSDHPWKDARPPVDARAILSSAAGEGVHLLVEEGRYDFVLGNGARLRLFASPWTPKYGSWAFQYERGEGHEFGIGRGVDVAVTHGPPRGILDRTSRGQEAGCGHLLECVKGARPRVHCFGHIHEGWGAKVVKWEEKNEKDTTGGEESYGTLGEYETELIENMETMEGNRLDSMEDRVEKMARRNEWVKSHGARVVDATGVQPGKETLFVNAAVVNVHYKPLQLPWLIDLDLPQATDEDKQKAEETASLLQRYRDQALTESAAAPDHSQTSVLQKE